MSKAEFDFAKPVVESPTKEIIEESPSRAVGILPDPGTSAPTCGTNGCGCQASVKEAAD